MGTVKNIFQSSTGFYLRCKLIKQKEFACIWIKQISGHSKFVQKYLAKIINQK